MQPLALLTPWAFHPECVFADIEPPVQHRLCKSSGNSIREGLFCLCEAFILGSKRGTVRQYARDPLMAETQRSENQEFLGVILKTRGRVHKLTPFHLS
jgi:hypothetical protein